MNSAAEIETLQIRVHSAPEGPTLIYLPGLHGDWTLVTPFRRHVAGHATFVELTYPRTLEWSLQDYAARILSALDRNNIRHGWLLAESFGSQIAWAICDSLARSGGTAQFRLQALVLAGGFGPYPVKPAARWIASRRTRSPGQRASLTMRAYALLLRLRFFRCAEDRQAVAEFIARRTPLDRAAILHRLRLLIDNDPRPVMARFRLPLYYLTGFVDPIVPWFLIRPALRRQCPGFRESKIIFSADHNVLGTAPKPSLVQILKWTKT
jgi:pimeloyl-ACP methyl ester carboxylesterase